MTDFVRPNRSKPFFAYFATNLPHDKYQLAVRPEYTGKDWPEGQKIYASMVTSTNKWAIQPRCSCSPPTTAPPRT